MGRIEQWIKQKLAPAVASGSGVWVDSPESKLGKPIYEVATESVTLVLSERGFVYKDNTCNIECMYDKISDIKFASLQEINSLRGDLRKMVPLGITYGENSDFVLLNFPLRIYSNVVPVIGRIVKEMA